MQVLSLSRPVLVLDAGYQPVNVVNLKRAVTLVCAGKAVVLQADDSTPLRSDKLVLSSPRTTSCRDPVFRPASKQTSTPGRTASRRA
jgi:hypothetical protein